LLDGRYRLQSLIGQGAIGQVFKAQDTRLGRRVAIKLIRVGADENLVERLFREAKAAARAEHPAVVTSYGYGTDPDCGLDYLVMELLQGETLAERVARSGPLPFPLIAHVGRELADALDALHAASVVHRDLKPSNIFLAQRGRRVDEIKMLDFGVAKQLDLDSLTHTGEVYGTPMYMAPEQLCDSKRVDARCDLYSVGAVLFECATGRTPFEASNVVALASAVLFGPQPDPGALRPDIPAPLAAVIERCMRRDPSERFADARALYDAFVDPVTS
jgi:serine/threonine protein kinase